jgi:uncharacterized protein DUF6817
MGGSLRGHSDQSASLSAAPRARLFERCLRAHSRVLRAGDDALPGTASILAELRAAEPVVAAGLLHAAYGQGDFGFIGWRHRRDYLRGIVGSQAEDLVWRYDRLKWYGGGAAAQFDRFDTLDEIERTIILMRLANELDDHMNFAHQLSGEREYGHGRQRDIIVRIAEKLGQDRLATALRGVYAAPDDTTWLALLRTSHTGSYQLAWSRGATLRKLLRYVPTRYLPF